MKKTALIALCSLAMTGAAFAGGPDVSVSKISGTPVVSDGGLINPSGLLYDNGTIDYLNGLSSAGVGAFGSRRSLLDDFSVPAGGWDIGGASTLLIWSSGARLVGTDLEIQFFEGGGCAPGALVATAPTTSYLAIERDDLGDLFGRLIEQVDVTFDCVSLPEGDYYMEMVAVGPENAFVATAPLNGCGEVWVNYDDLGGLQPGSNVFGAEYDVVFSLMDCGVSSCLDLSFGPLVGGENTVFEVSGGQPGHRGVVAWGLGGNPSSFIDVNGWCATFGFDINLSGNTISIVGSSVFDDNGEMRVNRLIPGNHPGLEVLFQAAERETCPGECMSEVVGGTIG